jgi:UDP-N-acetylglucosamine 1-carboxyvinyltransferase
MVLRALGAEVWVEGESLCATAKNGLIGADIHLPIRSTGATENGIIAGTLAHGVTRIWNPHIRPEILDLVRFLNGRGAMIEVYGQECIEITGVEDLGAINFQPIYDSMEALTWLVGASITGGDIEILNFPWEDLKVPLIFLRASGALVFRGPSSIVVRGRRIHPVEISTGSYPGINSDMQPLFAVFGVCAAGESRIVDLRFPGRYGYANELRKMGADAQIRDNMLVIRGGLPLRGCSVHAPDLRAGVALALAGLVAEGQTTISDAWQIQRGYNSFTSKLQELGATVRYE